MDTRSLVDEISTFLIGSTVGIKDLYRLGKRPTDVTERSRPTIVKYCTVWDKRLILSAKSKLKSFRLGKIFIRSDLSKKERQERQENQASRKALHVSVTEVTSHSTSHPISSSPSSPTSSSFKPQVSASPPASSSLVIDVPGSKTHS